MLIDEFNTMFDVYYNNITSNQAPGLDGYEKSLFLTRAEKEVVKNHFTVNSKGNNLGLGFDDSRKREADFSVLVKTHTGTLINTGIPQKIDYRSSVYSYPNDVFIVLNESVTVNESHDIKQVVTLRYDEYTRLMSKPYKRPLKTQVWKLLNSGVMAADNSTGSKGTSTKYVEIIAGLEDSIDTYLVRYVRTPEPIIVETLTGGLSIDGKTEKSTKCELDPILHEEVLQRAVELAKLAWVSTGQENTQAELAAGQRVE